MTMPWETFRTNEATNILNEILNDVHIKVINKYELLDEPVVSNTCKYYCLVYYKNERLFVQPIGIYDIRTKYETIQIEKHYIDIMEWKIKKSLPYKLKLISGE
jgi:hypothetical protein